MNAFDWQSPAAAAVVLATAGLWVVRFLRRRGRLHSADRPCGNGCDCPAKPARPLSRK